MSIIATVSTGKFKTENTQKKERKKERKIKSGFYDETKDMSW